MWLPDLYSNWLCPRCELFKESFNHVWLCNCISSEMNQIILDTKSDLVQILSEVVTASCPARIHLVPLSLLDQHSMWSLQSSDVEFTFIDLLKGFIPLELSSSIRSILNSVSTTHFLLSMFRDNLYNRIRDRIWSPRCDLLITKEQSLNITNRIKK